MLLVLFGCCELIEKSQNWKAVFLFFFAGPVEAGLFLPDKGSSTEPCPGILGAVLKGIIFTFETRSNSVAQDDPNLHPQSPKHWGGRHANRTWQTWETF